MTPAGALRRPLPTSPAVTGGQVGGRVAQCSGGGRDLFCTSAFLGESGTRVLYTIEGGSSARDVRRYSEFPAEAEVLMPFGSAFTVVTALQAQAPTPANDQASLLLVTLQQTHDFALPA